MRLTLRNRRSIIIKLYLATVVLAASIANQTARAQDPSQMPSAELVVPGVAGKLPGDAPSVSELPDVDFTNAEARGMQFGEAAPRTRGLQDISLFREAAPSVVLIIAKGSLGSGSLIQINREASAAGRGVSNDALVGILTNFHVIDQNREVTVVFKPSDPGGNPSEDASLTMRESSGQRSPRTKQHVSRKNCGSEALLLVD